MCGIDFVPPFQGLNLFWGRCSQGVALGCHVSTFQAAIYRATGAVHDSPGQSEASPRDKWLKGLIALKGQNKSCSLIVAMPHSSPC
jgi:hypothetical protein